MSEQNNIYLQRINLVMDYITGNLDGDLSLQTLANVAGFSPFHFHRIFRSITDEPLNQFVARVRVEQAAKLLRASPAMTILDAALNCGYTSASGFSRAFKRHFGISPQQWDRVGPIQDSKIGKASAQASQYSIQELVTTDNPEQFVVHIQALPPQRMAYVRVTNSLSDYQRIIDAHNRLLDWYQAKGGSLAAIRLFGMSEDDLDITPPDKHRFDWCVAIPETWQVDAGISERRFPAMQLATVHAVGDLNVLECAWQHLWRYWLPRSRYQPANVPAMELYRKLPHEIGWDTYDMLCTIPVERL